jgi:SAM-dependent methyltransferase/uncharacterized protein YbaR (Trm112 family)
MLPLCPACRAVTPELASIERRAGPEILEGILVCPNPTCRRETPIIDGIPLLLADLGSFFAHQGNEVMRRRDLSPRLESLIGDALGPSSGFDIARQHLSIYVHAHFSDALVKGAEPSSVAELFDAISLALAAAQLEPPQGRTLDLGCALGRVARELSTGSTTPVVGVDLNFAFLTAARALDRDGRLAFPKRRGGLVYETEQLECSAGRPIEFWLADACSLPCADRVFSSVWALNVLDCVAAPLELLREISRVLVPGGLAILTTPWDWSPQATPPQAWIGGHSQRGSAGGASRATLRALLENVETPLGLELAFEGGPLPWRLRLHDHAVMAYEVDLFVLRRRASEP